MSTTSSTTSSRKSRHNVPPSQSLTSHSKIPFYYAEEATEAIKPMLGDLYCRDDRSFIGQLWSNYTNLKYVEADAAGAMKWVHKMQ